jgi:hypothetical protein
MMYDWSSTSIRNICSDDQLVWRVESTPVRRVPVATLMRFTVEKERQKRAGKKSEEDFEIDGGALVALIVEDRWARGGGDPAREHAKLTAFHRP